PAGPPSCDRQRDGASPLRAGRDRVSYLQEYQGRLRYLFAHRVGAHRLLVAVPCRLADLEDSVDVLLDPAADRCVLPPNLADVVGHTQLEALPYRLSTRLGTFMGALERIPVHFADEGGYVLTVDATWFISPDWPGPAILGWTRCLERFPWAVDPREEYF